MTQQLIISQHYYNTLTAWARPAHPAIDSVHEMRTVIIQGNRCLGGALAEEMQYAREREVESGMGMRTVWVIFVMMCIRAI